MKPVSTLKTLSLLTTRLMHTHLTLSAVRRHAGGTIRGNKNVNSQWKKSPDRHWQRLKNNIKTGPWITGWRLQATRPTHGTLDSGRATRSRRFKLGGEIKQCLKSLPKRKVFFTLKESLSDRKYSICFLSAHGVVLPIVSELFHL